MYILDISSQINFYNPFYHTHKYEGVRLIFIMNEDIHFIIHKIKGFTKALIFKCILYELPVQWNTSFFMSILVSMYPPLLLVGFIVYITSCSKITLSWITWPWMKLDCSSPLRNCMIVFKRLVIIFVTILYATLRKIDGSKFFHWP